MIDLALQILWLPLTVRFVDLLVVVESKTLNVQDASDNR
jgi:hypothetical protein